MGAASASLPLVKRLVDSRSRTEFENLLLHKLRTSLTMLGMIFGVAAVLSMLSIGAGAQQQVMAFIEDLGVRNLIVEARETTEWQANQKMRMQSPGLTFQDVRAIQASVPGIDLVTPRKRFAPTRVVPKPDTGIACGLRCRPQLPAISNPAGHERPVLYGHEAARAAAVCVLGEAARWRLFGDVDPLGRFVKINEQWFEVIGIVGPQAVAQGEVGGIPAQDRNNLIYVPTMAAILRLEDNYSMQRDEIDGVFVRLKNEGDIRRICRDCPRDPGEQSPRRERLLADCAGGAAGGAAADQAYLRHRHGRACVDFAAGRWDRDHEHHAGECHGTHA